MNAKEAQAAMAADLERSGLSLADCPGWKLCDAKTIAAMFPKAGVEWAYKIPYPHSKCIRYRVLSWQPLPFGAVRADAPKYLQAPRTTAGVFLAPNYDWGAVHAGKGELVIVEGEKKALAGCKAGFNVIGLGGVWSWKSKATGQEMIQELAGLDLEQRTVFICFDSDAKTNAQVAAAIAAFVALLIKKGAVVHVATLPELVKGDKCGLDDFLLLKGAEPFRAHLDASGTTGDLAKMLWQFNARYAVIRDGGIVVDEHGTDDHDRPLLRIMDASRFKSVIAANIQTVETVVTAGQAKSKPVKVAERWIEWEPRREYEKLTYDPGKPRVLNHGSRLNTWMGLGCEPKKGDMSPWRKLLDHMFKGGDQAHRLWFEQWLGWPLREPGAKLSSAVGVWGLPGRGKSIVAEHAMAAIYGRNFTSISQIEFEESFNEWAGARQFVLVDEVSANDSRALGDRFKKLITQKEIRVNEKFVPKYTLPDHINYYLTSNSPRAFYVEDEDRRFFIHRVPDEQLPREFFDVFVDDWLAIKGGQPTGSGAPALLHYFLHELNYCGFRPHAPPPMTEAKDEMIETVRHPAVHWLKSFASDPMFEACGKREVWTVGELFALYRSVGGQGAGNVSANGFGAYVASAGLLKRRFSDARLVAVASIPKWFKAGRTAWLVENARKGKF
jgi:hypothetical protein